MAQLIQWLWKQEYWLPPGFTWEDMQETEDIRYPQPCHLLLCLPITLLLVTLQFFFERKIAIPLSKKLGLQEKVRRKPSPYPILEAFYKKWRKSPPKEEVSSLAKQCDLQPRQVERWFRYRLNQDRPSLTKKFCEVSWRAIYFIISVCAGWAILYNKPWFWDFRECWVGYPKQPLQLSIFSYFLIQLSFYWSLLIMLPFDVKQKDFHQQIVHHLVTIFLIGLSYCVNYIRIGLLMIFLTDCSHCLLEAAKMFNYLKWQKTCDTLFIAFSAVFLIIHLVIFPSKILHNTWYYFMELYPPFFGYYFFNTLLIVLQLLHVFWSYLIICMVYRFLIHGTVEKDVRSDPEDSEDKDGDELGQKSECQAPTSLPNLGGRGEGRNGCGNGVDRILIAPVIRPTAACSSVRV
ncbi:ceramide synthase 2-like isoform X2 [Pantherophis guttatus]|nr:ceramide synthase 2-like isoform X2 [Pantherophis guttatus]XP_060543099.1 ceramide synthase 2-like isoform X2 [Pantherophis guttatus]